MPSRHTLAARLKRLLGQDARSTAVRGTWREARSGASSYRPLPASSASLADELPDFYRSEAFAEDLMDGYASR